MTTLSLSRTRTCGEMEDPGKIAKGIGEERCFATAGAYVFLFGGEDVQRCCTVLGSPCRQPGKLRSACRVCLKRRLPVPIQMLTVCK